MKTTTIVLISLGLATLAHANMILTSDLRSVSVSGSAGAVSPQTYSESQTPSAAFASFNGNVTGSAFAAPQPPNIYPSESSASVTQTSSITSTSISLFETSSINAGYGSNAVLAKSVFEIGFTLATSHTYALTGFFSPSGDGPGADFSFTSDHGVIVSSWTLLNAAFPGSVSGTLLPGDYLLKVDSLGNSLGGEFGNLTVDLNFVVTGAAVPDTGSTLLLLCLSLGVVVRLRSRLSTS